MNVNPGGYAPHQGSAVRRFMAGISVSLEGANIQLSFQTYMHRPRALSQGGGGSTLGSIGLVRSRLARAAPGRPRSAPPC
jgi:hypothetical protein